MQPESPQGVKQNSTPCCQRLGFNAPQNCAPCMVHLVEPLLEEFLPTATKNVFSAANATLFSRRAVSGGDSKRTWDGCQNVIWSGFARSRTEGPFFMPKTMRKNSKPATTSLPVPREVIETYIYWIRGRRVMRDTDLAKLYGVETFNLNKAVRRNLDRFPEDFMFQLTKDESVSLTFQVGMSKPRSRGADGRCRTFLRNRE